MPPQDANPTPSFGGFGLRLIIAFPQSKFYLCPISNLSLRHDPAAVDVDGGAGNEAGAVAGQKVHRACVLRRLRIPPERDLRE